MTNKDIYVKELEEANMALEIRLEASLKNNDDAEQYIGSYYDLLLDIEYKITENKECKNTYQDVAFRSKVIREICNTIIKDHIIYRSRGYLPADFYKFKDDRIAVPGKIDNKWNTEILKELVDERIFNPREYPAEEENSGE